jgi:hypothetical protein
MNELFKNGHKGVLALLLCITLFLTCVSTTTVLYHTNVPEHPMFWHAVGGAVLLAAFIPLFVHARFSFGYLLGINFYCVIIGFVWLSYFPNPSYDIAWDSYFNPASYDHSRARWSIAASLLLLLMPLLFQTSPLRRRFELSPSAMNRLLLALLALSVVVLACNARYGFAFVAPNDTDQLRNALAPRPGLLNYLTGWFVGAALPFAFAYFATQRRVVPALLSILMIIAFYPVLLNKTVAFAAIWLPFLFLIFTLLEARRAAVCCLLVPMTAGLIALELAPYIGAWIKLAHFAYGTVNYRMLAVPSIVIDRYSDFFASHRLTYFCQIGFVRALVGCPYEFQLGAEMAKQYDMGNLNGSLFATEGIASVGPLWAPVSALICGLILSLANSVSSGLPRPFVATSSGLVILALLNVPLSASLLSNGLFALMLLWYVTPRELGADASKVKTAAPSR